MPKGFPHLRKVKRWSAVMRFVLEAGTPSRQRIKAGLAQLSTRAPRRHVVAEAQFAKQCFVATWRKPTRKVLEAVGMQEAARWWRVDAKARRVRV